jgi:hypothetical protein
LYEVTTKDCVFFYVLAMQKLDILMTIPCLTIHIGVSA